MGSEPSSGNQKLCVDDGVQERGQTYSKAQQEAGLPDSRVSDQQQLEEVVAAGDMRLGQNHCFILGNTLPITCWTADKSNLSMVWSRRGANYGPGDLKGLVKDF